MKKNDLHRALYAQLIEKGFQEELAIRYSMFLSDILPNDKNLIRGEVTKLIDALIGIQAKIIAGTI